MNRALSGTVVVLESRRPLPGMTVVAGRLGGGGVEPLGTGQTGPDGRFRVEYPPLTEAADLTLLLLSPGGDLIYTEPPHRSIAGAELRLLVEVPGRRLTDARSESDGNS